MELRALHRRPSLMPLRTGFSIAEHVSTEAMLMTGNLVNAKAFGVFLVISPIARKPSI